MSIKEFNNMEGSQKLDLIYRVFMGLALSFILWYVKSADTKLTKTVSDVAHIKWELPLIKDSALRDKKDIIERIHEIEIELDNVRKLGDTKAKDISELHMEIELLKQKLQ